VQGRKQGEIELRAQGRRKQRSREGQLSNATNSKLAPNAFGYNIVPLAFFQHSIQFGAPFCPHAAQLRPLSCNVLVSCMHPTCLRHDTIKRIACTGLSKTSPSTRLSSLPSCGGTRKVSQQERALDPESTTRGEKGRTTAHTRKLRLATPPKESATCC